MFTITILVLGFLLIFLLLKSNIAITKHDALIASLDSNINSQVNNHFSFGHRTDDSGITIADLSEFELDFANLMSERSTLTLKKELPYQVLYLVEHRNGTQSIANIDDVLKEHVIKAVLVKYTVDSQEYTIRYIVDENSKNIIRK